MATAPNAPKSAPSTGPKTAAGRVTRADIETKLRQLRGDLEDTEEVVKEASKGVAIGGIVLLLVLVFLLGKRRGRRKSTVVEIRRI